MADWLHDNPWRQGHVLTERSVKALGLSHPDAPDDTVVMVISHDCDLAGGIDVEPFCEVVVGRKIQASDGNFTNAKSVRRLHLTCSYGTTATLVELEVQNRTRIKKTELADHEPANGILLTAHERNLLQAWLAARYNRPSFPDAFVTRLTDVGRKAYRRFEKKLTDTSSHILAALFDLDEGQPDKERQQDEDVYTLSIYLVYSVDGDPAESRKVSEQVATDLQKIFEDEFKKDGQWHNIELVSCEAVSEETVTLRMHRLTRRWHLDHISFRGGHPVVSQ